MSFNIRFLRTNMNITVFACSRMPLGQLRQPIIGAYSQIVSLGISGTPYESIIDSRHWPLIKCDRLRKYDTYTSADSWSFLVFWYRSGVKSTVSEVFEDLKFKISEGYKQNWSWSQQGRARKTSILVLAFWNFKIKVLKYPRNCRLHATLILNLLKPLTIHIFTAASLLSTEWPKAGKTKR